MRFDKKLNTRIASNKIIKSCEEKDIQDKTCIFSDFVLLSQVKVFTMIFALFLTQDFFGIRMRTIFFFLMHLQTRIAMALPHACVSCYYVCYAENPENRLFDKTIKDRLTSIKSNRDVHVPTPRVPRGFSQHSTPGLGR